MAQATCSEDGCERPVKARGLCRMHSWRLEKYGDPHRTSAGVVGAESSRPRGLTVEERFWRYVDRRGENECWLWTGARDPNGYGRFNPGDHRTLLTHRLAWELLRGPIPPEKPYVLHHCDNPPCCNPIGTDHLFLGTQQDNNDDMMSKLRGVPISPCGTAAAYTRHIRRGETPCEPCRLAMAEYRQRRRGYSDPLI